MDRLIVGLMVILMIGCASPKPHVTAVAVRSYENRVCYGPDGMGYSFAQEEVTKYYSDGTVKVTGGCSGLGDICASGAC